jgi:hypothetical protein
MVGTFSPVSRSVAGFESLIDAKVNATFASMGENMLLLNEHESVKKYALGHPIVE